ncbi:MAG: hypothetical protein ACYSW7_00170 [Planctomycetota bacterium]|jgi:hypothetical protein
MATRQNDKTELTKIVGAISKLAGTVVGTAVVTGKRVVKNVTPSSRASSGLGKKSTQTSAKRKKKAAPKKKAKGLKAKKKRKVVKREGTGRPRKRGTSEEKSVQAPAKRKKTTARKAGTKSQKAKKKGEIAKKKGTSPARKRGTSKKVEVVKEQEPQPEVAKVKLYGS